MQRKIYHSYNGLIYFCHTRFYNFRFKFAASFCTLQNKVKVETNPESSSFSKRSDKLHPCFDLQRRHIHMSMLQNSSKVSIGIGSLFGAALVGVVWWRRTRKSRKISRVIDMLEDLKKPSVHIKDKERVEALVCELIKGGKDKLQVIADFDRTITRYKTKDGKINSTCHNALDESTRLPRTFQQQLEVMRDTYYSIEIDHSRTQVEKYPYMVEWWTKAHDLLVQCNLSQDEIKTIIREAHIMLRDGCDWTFHQLHKVNVPLLIFSAGLGDVIEETISLQSHMYDNMKIVSNYMDFNGQGVLCGFKGELIHIYNKNENTIHKSDYFEKIAHRHNVILLGDSMGDLHMAEGCEAENLLKIGFLNNKVEERMQEYLEGYDIVLVGDETFDVPNGILKSII